MKKGLSPKIAGSIGCIAGVALTILVLVIALCVFIVRWGNRQEWPVSPDGSTAVAADSVSVSPEEGDAVFLGSYEQVNDDGGDVQLRIEAWGSELAVTLASFGQPRLYATGEIDPEKTRRSERGGVELKTTLKQYDNDYNVTFADDVTITLDQRPDSLYDLSVRFDREPSQSAIQVLKEKRRLFLVHPDEHEMVNALPFNINKEKPTMAAMLTELHRYVFCYELDATVKHIKRGFDATELDETENVVFDERHRYFCYSCGAMNVCLEGKCCKMSDGRVLLVIDQHDPTYENGQRLRFFVIDTERQTIAERMRHQMLPERQLERGDAIFQVERHTETLLTVYGDPSGEAQVETLRFDGQRFN